MQELLRRYRSTLTGTLVILTAFWLLAMVIIPNLVMLETSFRPYLPVEEMGGPRDVYTFMNYVTFFDSPIHIKIFFQTVLYSSAITILCLVLSYPVAYYLARRRSPFSFYVCS